jgi:hypothetical protein
MVTVKDKSYLIKTRILVGDFFGASPEDGFIELIEPDVMDSTRLTQMARKAKTDGDDSVMMVLFRELMPGLISDHSIYATEETKHSPEEVTKIIFSKMDLVTRVIDQYGREVLFTLGKKSDAS